MKPMPASATQRPTCSGLMSILTPSEESTSAAPERDDSARLPCLATGTPAPATIKEAQVETLTEPEPSPPVPTTSTALPGALTRSILARIADTAPVISSTVSPRTRSAINSPPICEGVASPDIMLSKADAASSRDSVAPVATFPMIDFRSSIAFFQNRGLMVRRPSPGSLFGLSGAPSRTMRMSHPSRRGQEAAPQDEVNSMTGADLHSGSCSVIRARHLCEGGLIDGGADIRFKLCDVLRDLFIGQAALEGLLKLLHVVRSKVDRRHADVSHAEHDPFAWPSTGGFPHRLPAPAHPPPP